MSQLRVLLIDDETMLLDLLRRFLERQGFTAVACHSAQEALDQFRATPNAFDVVITDLTMPGMSGQELVEQMRALNPDVRALITSGYPYEPTLKGVGFLQKPFLPNMLGEAIAELMSARKSKKKA